MAAIESLANIKQLTTVLSKTINDIQENIESGTVRGDDCFCCEPMLNTDVGPKAVIKMDCLHKFHTACILQWLWQSPDNKCPICRQNVSSILPQSLIDGKRKLERYEEKEAQRIRYRRRRYRRRRNNRNHY